MRYSSTLTLVLSLAVGAGFLMKDNSPNPTAAGSQNDQSTAGPALAEPANKVLAEESLRFAASHKHSGEGCGCSSKKLAAADLTIQQRNLNSWPSSVVSELEKANPHHLEGVKLLRRAVAYEDYQQIEQPQQQRLLRYAEYAVNGTTLTLPHLCWAQATPPVLQSSFAEVRALALTENGSLEPERAQQASNRWTRTAVDGFTGGVGSAVTLTWSFVPDGTDIVDGLTDAAGNPATQQSNLIQAMNDAYGSSPTGNLRDAPWFSLFEQAFEEWAQVTGNVYIYEENDDGADLPFTLSGNFFRPTSNGLRNVRGDIRISGARIDGDSGTLAFNYFPGLGDMVIDTADRINLNNTRLGRTRFVNTIAHEHGHGLGLSHVCPVNQTKLMEPFLSTRFQGVQFDDILTIQGMYGDALEGNGNNTNNDSANNATVLGNVSGSLSAEELSISTTGDRDFFVFQVNERSTVEVQVEPTTVAAYLEGSQNGACSAGTLFDPRIRQDLQLRVFEADGVTLVGASESAAIGATESLTGLTLEPGRNYVVRVTGGGENSSDNNNAQLYSLQISQSAAAVIPEVSITVLDAVAAELDTSDVARMQVTASEAGHGGLNVAYTVSGTASSGSDFIALAGALQIPAGTTTNTITITPRSDNQSEGEETVMVNLLPSADYTIGDSVATVRIADLPVDDWRFDNFGNALVEVGDTDDFDGDGLPNLVEYALGADPTQRTSALTSSVSPDGSQLQLTFIEDTRLADVSYTVECSTSLVSTSWDTNGVTMSRGPLVNGRRQVVASINLNEQRKFLRLRVSRNQ